MYSKREVYICACIGKCLHARIIFSFHKNNITDLDKIISWHIIGQNVVSSFCNWGMSSSSTSAVSGRAGIRSPSEPDRTPVFKQKLKSDSNWVQSLRSSNYSQPYLTSSVSRKYTEDLSEVDQLLLEGKVLRKVQSTVRKNSWNQSLKILMEQEKSMQETDNTTPRLLRKKGTAKLQDGNGISENFEPSGFQSPALQKFDEHEYQAFAKSVQSGRVSQNLKKELQSATGSARSPMQNNKHGSRSLSSLSATFAPPVLPGVDIISEHATHKKRDLTFMSHGSGAIYDAAIHVLNGKSSSVKNRELKAQYLRPNSTVEAMQSLVNGAVTGRKQSSISDSDATDGGTTTLPSAVLKHSATKQPRLTSSPPRSRHLASTSARAHSTPLSLTSANDFDIRLLASSSAVKRPQSANALLSSSRTSPHSVGDITGTYSGPSSPSKVTVQALRGNAQAKSSTMTVQSPDAVFVAPKFTLAQRAALDGRKAKSANLARAATAAQTRGRNIVGNGQGKSGVSMGSINLMRSLENIRHLEASHKEHALREPQSLVSSSRNPNIRLISSAHQKPSKNSAVARISSKLDTELRTPSNDISGRALQVVLHSKGLSPHSLMLPKASTNDKNNGIPHFRDRNREAAEDRLFSRRQFVPPPFSHAVDATHKRLYKKAQENMAKHSIGHGLQTPYVDSNDNLKPSVMMRSMDPDNNTENRNPVEANLLDRSLRLAHSNVSLDKISEGRHPGRPRRGKTLRNSPRQLEFAHQTNNSTYQSPASRRYLNQVGIVYSSVLLMHVCSCCIYIITCSLSISYLRSLYSYTLFPCFENFLCLLS